MNVTEVMNVIGDVRGRTCLILDDIIDTAGTLVKTVDALLENGARKKFMPAPATRCFRARQSSASPTRGWSSWS
jgi:phosphoribosylpyrophosphate synthetase